MLFSPIGVSSVAVAQNALIQEAEALVQEASKLHGEGRHSEAIPLAERAVGIAEEVLGPEHPHTATALNNVAELYRATGAFGQAAPLYQRALTIYEKVLGVEHPATATALNNLALLYHAMGTFGQAEPLYQRALAINEKVLGPEHPHTSTSLNNLAELYRAMGAYDKAEPLVQRALAITEKVLGPEHPATATALNNLAILYRAMGAYAKATPLYQRVLVIREKVLGSEHPDTGTTLKNIGVLHWATGDFTGALSPVERSHVIREKNLATFLLTGSESRKISFLENARGSTFSNITLSLVMPERQAKELGLLSVLQTKGRVLDAMSDSFGRLRQSVMPEDRELFEQLTKVAQGLSILIWQGLGNLKPETYQQRLQELTYRKEQLEAELSAHSAEFRQWSTPITLAAVQEVLPNNAALVEWYRYEPFDPIAKNATTSFGRPRYAAYVLHHEGEPVVVDLGEAEPLDRLILEFRDAVSDPQNTFVREVAQELSDKLIRALHVHLGNTKRLLLSPDGALNLIPFAALIDETGSYLGSRYEIVYLTSGRDLLRLETPTAAKNPGVIVADPDYGQPVAAVAQTQPSLQLIRSVDLDRGGMTFQPLAGTATEAAALKNLLKLSAKQVLTQGNATETRFKQLVGPRILHIATHGFFLKDNELPAAALKPVTFSQEQITAPVGENPLLRSGLALAGANARRSGEKDDGILTAAEVAQMDLRGTQLVVLSACETGIGDVHNGEGVYGLRRALVLAGAETQVTSLWKVSDDATKDLMVDYYRRLLKGEGRSEALRNAQLAMIRSKDRSHPYYWAAFVPIGNWTPLAKNK